MVSLIYDATEPIVVVGIGCRFPGSATSPSELWQMLCRGESAWSEIPKDRLNVSSSIPFTAGHFLTQDVGASDSSFFSILADEAKAIDPQQRMLLEVSVEALDSAGVDRTALKKSDTGVWIGSFVKDYEQIVLRDPDNSPKYGATGNGIAIMSNRISFFLDINGPSMTIDTGCSASLVCAHNACQSLRNGEIDIGLAGGAGLILTPNIMMLMTALNFLSPDGKYYTFDARANDSGRLSDAIRDNDNIHAIIRGITLPSAEAQLRNIRTVYKRAGLPVDNTAYVECHGTGTQAGYWRELKAISDVFCAERSSDNPIYVGLVKTNIGHLKGCAGIAGLVKGILTIENGMIPQHLNFEAPGNLAIDFNAWKVKVPIGNNTPWTTEGLRRASVNCFGFGGTNAHVILDDAAHYLAQRGLSAHRNTTLRDSTRNLPNLSTTTHQWARSVQGMPIPTRDSKTHLFIFSAHEQKVLTQMLKDYASYTGRQLKSSPGNIMEDFAYTLGCRRTQLQWRAPVVARSPEELVQKLPSIRSAFVFGGQGARWFSMGRELLGFDAFLQSIEEASLYLQTKPNAPFSHLAELLRDESHSLVNQPEISQPATTAIQMAIVDLLTKYFGVSPNYVCGHSSGEIAATYTLGALSREDAWELAFHRGRCAEAMLTSKNEEYLNGSMLVVGLPASEVRKYVDLIGNDKVVACINSPASMTLSGDESAIKELQGTFQDTGIFNRLLVVDIAYHSHHMKRCENAYLQSIAHIKPKKPRNGTITHPHNLRGLVTPSDIRVGTNSVSLSNDVPHHYWVRNMVSPVLFAEAMHRMLSVKIVSHSSLQGPIRQILDAEEKLRQRPVYAFVLHRGKDAATTLLEAAGKLWGNGNVQTERPRLLVDLPKYPWNHNKVHGRYDLIGTIIYPAADMATMQKAMIVPDTPHGDNQMAVAPIGNSDSPSLAMPSASFEFSIYSKQLDKPWEEHGSGYEECVDPVNPRQLYESLDIIGMNYGRLFQNIESPHRWDGVCVGTIRIPDTKSVMPAKFEYPHIIHPKTLDSVFQTALSFGNGPMVFSFLGNLYLSANSPMLSGAGKQLAAHTCAKLNGRLSASAFFVVSDQSWLETSGANPLMIIEDMTFTALDRSATQELGFLPNHRSLCSEIIWEEFNISENSNEQHIELTDNLLILIPVDASPNISGLEAELSKNLNCQFRTLSSIKENEILPRYSSAMKGIFWITRASQLEALGRTIQSEYPKKKLATFDVGIDLNFSSTIVISFTQTLLRLIARSFFKPQIVGPIETEYIERNRKIMVPRLIPVNSLNSMIERGSAPAEPDQQTMPNPHERPLKLEVGQVGDTGGLYWGDDPDANLLSPDDARVRVITTTLGDLDREIMHGRVEKGDLGTDVYGVVDQIGENVTSVSPSDYVVGIARGSLRDFVTCHHRLLYRVPNYQSELQPIYLPTSFSIARYALGKLKSGHTILIHAGAGTFGQTAIQRAKSVGAVVFTSAETDHERGLLSHVWGLGEEYILDARTEAFADTVMRLTDNQGVDLIYDLVARSRDLNIRCVKEGGRVIGFADKPDRNDVTTRETDVIGKTFSCIIIYVSHLIKYQPDRLGDALASIYPKLLSWQFRSWNQALQDVYDYSDLAAAFAALDSDTVGAHIYCWRHTSKPIPIIPRTPSSMSSYLRGGATYVLSGGLGGLGIEVAKLLVANGTKNIAFLGRSGATNDLAKSCVNLLHTKRVNVRVFKVGICIFHCAAVLRDSVFETMKYEDWKLATKPKTVGSWNLHQAFGNDLDFFIFLSSSADIIGNRAQANYAAGNAFQDSLARHIKTTSEGKVNAVSIDLGPVLEAGMLADDHETLDKLKASRFFGTRREDIKCIIERAVTGYMEDGQRIPVQIVTGVGTGGLILQNKPADPYWTRTAMFTHLNQVDMPEGSEETSEEASGSREVMQRLLAQATDAEEARCIASKGLREMLSKSMNMDSAGVDESRPPSAFGVDTLVVGVRNWVSRECEADVSIFEVLSETSIGDLSATIVQ
ncbi:ketoacyl-synt-domain-containing protein [Daldinia decipiens]|uniref:ketoacyl-synt-domain-containing protein n=1 Tax=Daldinia decipiens TaxID=326647 RepID=UPI0020C403F2|nr:ketoacyl-synt-domain-containing protein [Daldinia decipiens]KAI1654630.1 ketoacyl-synt-domain-containing protein [Daldinia decipiens]